MTLLLYFNPGWSEADGGALQVSTATTMAGVLAQMWEGVVPRDAASCISPPSTTHIFFPDCRALAEPHMLNKLVDHLETCKDVCDHFGSSVMAFPLDPQAPPDHPAHAPVIEVHIRESPHV